MLQGGMTPVLDFAESIGVGRGCKSPELDHLPLFALLFLKFSGQFSGATLHFFLKSLELFLFPAELLQMEFQTDSILIKRGASNGFGGLLRDTSGERSLATSSGGGRNRHDRNGRGLPGGGHQVPDPDKKRNRTKGE